MVVQQYRAQCAGNTICSLHKPEQKEKDTLWVFDVLFFFVYIFHKDLPCLSDLLRVSFSFIIYFFVCLLALDFFYTHFFLLLFEFHVPRIVM